MKSNSCYIHIPFCRNICSYCDFAKVIVTKKMEDSYFKSLFLELEEIKNNKFKTVYIGGGTPSCIDYEYLIKLLSFFKDKMLKNYEFCIECNVEDINEKFLSIIKEYGINRLSIGIQTFNDKFIKLCNRHHTKEMAIKNVNLASKYISNISIDLIYALPFQTLEELEEDVKLATSLPVKHISYYSLLIEEKTLLYTKKYENMDDNLQAIQYEYIYNYLKKHHFHRYEISNFAKKGYESKHNKVYWKNMHYYGIGLNASGYLGNTRYTNCNDLYHYDINSKSDITKLSRDDIRFEQIMLNLRLDRGMSISYYNKRFKKDFLNDYKNEIKELLDLGLIEIKNNYIKATFRGSLLLNDVLEKFM